MRTAIHPASAHDLGAVASILADVHGAPDSGAALLRHAAPSEAELPTHPFRAGGTRGDWIAAPGTASTGVLLYLHARRFQVDEPPGVFAGRLSEATRLPVLLLRYRLAPADPYPAPLDDVLDAYRGLLDQGTPPGRIVFVGHSAGATLTLSALLALGQAGRPMPAGAVAISPITDFTFSGESLVSNAGRDVVTMTELEQTREAYLGGTDPAMAPASPLADVPGGLPPLLIACGDSEMFLDDATRFAEAAADQGADVELNIFQGMPHGFPLLALEAADTLMNRVAEFTTSRLTGISGAAARELSVRRIGWAGYEIVTERGTRLVVDPYLRGSEGIHSGIPASPVPVADLAGADVIAVTHAGYDHRGQALQIAQAGHAVLVCGSALFAAAMKAGFPPDRLAVMVSGVEFQYRDITLKSLPARHESTMTIDGAFVADQPQSFLLTTADGARVFCGGDTSLSEDLRTWGEIYHPSIAILGIGGLWLGAVKIIELPPSEAAVAVRWLGVSTVIPVHHHPSDPAPAQLAAELAGSGIEVAALDFGATWTAPRR